MMDLCIRQISRVVALAMERVSRWIRKGPAASVVDPTNLASVLDPPNGPWESKDRMSA